MADHFRHMGPSQGVGANDRERDALPERKKAANDAPPAPDAESARFFRLLDKNADGFLSKDEMPERLRDRFGYLDLNGDKRVDLDEFQKATKYFRAMEGTSPVGVGGGASARQILNESDRDADGRVTRKEARGILSDHFDDWDSDQNGQLDLLEIEAGMHAERTPADPKKDAKSAPARRKLEKSKPKK